MRKTIFGVFTLFFISIIFENAQGQTDGLIEILSSQEFDSPIGLEFSHTESPFVYVLERRGYIERFDKSDPDGTFERWFELPDDVDLRIGAEGGLLGLAFHPNYPNNNTFFVKYTYEDDDNDQFYSRISRFYTSDGMGDRTSEEVILDIEQPRTNHNGGALEFGADGYLYISTGDGGGTINRDNSQDRTNLLGNILRIDVDTEEGYLIPPDNPFLDDPEVRDEIYAWGLRNPWRMSFDRETGQLWVADVGPSSWEMIHIIEKGKNYGWPIIAGRECHTSSSCDKTGLEMPVFEYEHGADDTGRSITGGYVYRGSANPSLYGKYIYGDFISGRIWALEIDHETWEVLSNIELMNTDLLIPSFGIDSDKELYVIGWGSESRIFRFVPELTLTSLSMNELEGSDSIQLNWDVNQNAGVEEFNVYRGSDHDDLSLYVRVPSDIQEYVEIEIPDGTTFYAVSAVNSDGTESDLSNPVSYVNSTEEIGDRWSLISLTFETDGIPLSNSVVYAFDGTYQVVDQLVANKGYWARSVESEAFEARGAGIQRTVLSLRKGWNIASSLVSELPVEFIEDPDGILSSTPMFVFNGSVYEEVESIMPGMGYWIYADEAGDIVLDLENIDSAQSSAKPVAETTEESSIGFDRLLFSTGGSQIGLNFSAASVDSEIKNRFRVPPIAPNPLLDVRTPDGFIMTDSERTAIELTAESYPVQVRFERGSSDEEIRSQTYSYKLLLEESGDIEEVVLSVGESTSIYKEYDSISIERIQSENGDELVRETKLLPSYPNPFNPVTNLSYRIAEQLNVEVSIYDATGRRVAVVLNEEQAPGQYTVPFNASSLASGIYFVRLQAGSFVDTQKLTLIK